MAYRVFQPAVRRAARAWCASVLVLKLNSRCCFLDPSGWRIHTWYPQTFWLPRLSCLTVCEPLGLLLAFVSMFENLVAAMFSARGFYANVFMLARGSFDLRNPVLLVAGNGVICRSKPSLIYWTRPFRDRSRFQIRPIAIEMPYTVSRRV
jgi:hypothetical protein